MSYIKKCINCGHRISMRQMPYGQWVPFDINEETVHDCLQGHSRSRSDSGFYFDYPRTPRPTKAKNLSKKRRSVLLDEDSKTKWVDEETWKCTNHLITQYYSKDVLRCCVHTCSWERPSKKHLTDT